MSQLSCGLGRGGKPAAPVTLMPVVWKNMRSVFAHLKEVEKQSVVAALDDI